jgi:hypothetical protein
LKDRSDIVVLTFNIDENPGLIEPFMQQNNYTFPVLAAKSLIQENALSPSIPRNWIVDGNAVIRQEMVGFLQSAKWEDQMVEALEKVKSGGTAVVAAKE